LRAKFRTTDPKVRSVVRALALCTDEVKYLGTELSIESNV